MPSDFNRILQFRTSAPISWQQVTDLVKIMCSLLINYLIQYRWSLNLHKVYNMTNIANSYCYQLSNILFHFKIVYGKERMTQLYVLKTVNRKTKKDKNIFLLSKFYYSLQITQTKALLILIIMVVVYRKWFAILNLI